MMYLSRGVPCKRSKRGIYIRHYGPTVELIGEEAIVWERGRLDFAYAESPHEEKVIMKLFKKELVVCVSGHREVDKYAVLCLSGVYANHRFKFGIIPLGKTEKRILMWLKKAGTNLSIAELICLEEKGIKPKANLLHGENSVKLMRIIYPHYISMAGDLEARMKHSVVRKRTIDAVMKLLRRQRVIII